MSSDPDEIRADIERTRHELSRDVDTLGDRVSPSSVARRQADKVKGGIGRLRERVMGTSQSAGGSMHEAASSVGDTAQEAAGKARDAVTQAPQTVLKQAEGNPLAAGLVAFGLGLVVASMIPASQREAEAAHRAKEAAAPLVEEAKGMASTVASNLKEPAQEQLHGLQESAKQAGSDLAEQGKAAASDVAQHGRTAVSDVRGEVGGAS
jgi:ElaB/YqjD/DUF883 family membrane-anchored ribosome-binding protein